MVTAEHLQLHFRQQPEVDVTADVWAKPLLRLASQRGQVSEHLRARIEPLEAEDTEDEDAQH